MYFFNNLENSKSLEEANKKIKKSEQKVENLEIEKSKIIDNLKRLENLKLDDIQNHEEFVKQLETKNEEKMNKEKENLRLIVLLNLFV